VWPNKIYLLLIFYFLLHCYNAKYVTSKETQTLTTNRVGARLNTTPRENKFHPHLNLKTDCRSHIFVAPNNKIFPDIWSVIPVVILKTVLFAFLGDVFRLLKINGHHLSKRASEIIFIWQKCNKRGCKMCRPWNCAAQAVVRFASAVASVLIPNASSPIVT
jgi:hypothetical protein